MSATEKACASAWVWTVGDATTGQGGRDFCSLCSDGFGVLVVVAGLADATCWWFIPSADTQTSVSDQPGPCPFIVQISTLHHLLREAYVIVKQETPKCH